jgi:hypothetical protein
MTYDQATNFNAFNEAFEMLYQVNDKLADYYVINYWDNDRQEWDYELIDDRVVKNIETDVMMTAGV